MRPMGRMWAGAAAAALAAGLMVGCSGKSSAESYCQAIRDHEGLATAFETNVAVDSSMSHEEVERRLAAAKAKLKRADDRATQVIDTIEDTAPDKVRPDAKRAAAYERRFLSAVRQAGYDLTSLAGKDQAGGLVQSNAEQLAAVRIDVDARDRCDADFTMAGASVISTGPPPPAPGPPASPGSPPTQPPPVSPGNSTGQSSASTTAPTASTAPPQSAPLYPE